MVSAPPTVNLDIALDLSKSLGEALEDLIGLVDDDFRTLPEVARVDDLYLRLGRTLDYLRTREIAEAEGRTE